MCRAVIVEHTARALLFTETGSVLADEPNNMGWYFVVAGFAMVASRHVPELSERCRVHTDRGAELAPKTALIERVLGEQEKAKTQYQVFTLSTVYVPVKFRRMADLKIT